MENKAYESKQMEGGEVKDEEAEEGEEKQEDQKDERGRTNEEDQQKTVEGGQEREDK